MTVLVGYLPSPEGEAAFAAGLTEAERRNERLVVLNSPRQGAPVDSSLANDEQVGSLVERAKAADVELGLQTTPHSDDMAEALLRTAAEVDASVIVIGLRRRSPVGKLLMGSTAQRLLLDSDLPVLAVKALKPVPSDAQ